MDMATVNNFSLFGLSPPLFLAWRYHGVKMAYGHYQDFGRLGTKQQLSPLNTGKALLVKPFLYCTALAKIAASWHGGGQVVVPRWPPVCLDQ